MAYNLCTEAEVLLAIGENASATQVLTANTTIWVNWAEGDMSAIVNNDLVANVGDIGTNWLRYFAQVAANRAAFHAINQNQDQWSLATTQSKLNVYNDSWQTFKKTFELKDGRSDVMDTIGL